MTKLTELCYEALVVAVLSHIVEADQLSLTLSELPLNVAIALSFAVCNQGEQCRMILIALVLGIVNDSQGSQILGTWLPLLAPVVLHYCLLCFLHTSPAAFERPASEHHQGLKDTRIV